MKALREVESYYDRNTQAFATFGQGGGAIHRAVWGDGVRTRAEAFHYVDRVLLREIERLAERALEPMQVLDLGCGVGSSLFYLASQAAFQGTGVTLSGVQARWAQAASEQSGLAERLKFIQGNFLELPSTSPRAHLAFSIEAFVHAESAGAFLAQVSRILRPGGRLVIVDDFLADTARPDTPPLEDFRNGWQAHSLLRVPDLAALASSYGLTLAGSVDLSSFQRLGRPRDRLIHALRPALRLVRPHSLWAESLVGGDALQTSYRLGLLNYRLVRFEKG